MRIVFVSSACSEDKYSEIYAKRTKPRIDSSQNFFDALLTGLAKNQMQVDTISALPVSHSCYNKLLIKKSEENRNGIHYFYCSFFNVPIVKSISLYFSVKRKLREYIKLYGEQELKVVCDPLNLEMSQACIRQCKKHGIPCIGLLTDMPLMSDFEQHGIIKKLLYKVYNTLSHKNLSEFDKYVLIAQEMNEDANPNNKPFMVMECIRKCADDDENTEDLQEKTELDRFGNSGLPVVLYAGKLHKEFGLDLLADAVDKIKLPCEVHIYGEGNFKEELKIKSENNKKLFVHDAVTAKEIFNIERKSDILINPRTSAGIFTKYSFPSKTAEYLWAGSPVVMFRLPAIPDEYEQYIYYAPNETAEDLAKTVDMVLGLPEDEKKKRSIDGRRFILNNKNNIAQAKRLIEFIGDEKC